MQATDWYVRKHSSSRSCPTSAQSTMCRAENREALMMDGHKGTDTILLNPAIPYQAHLACLWWWTGAQRRLRQCSSPLWGAGRPHHSGWRVRGRTRQCLRSSHCPSDFQRRVCSSAAERPLAQAQDLCYETICYQCL